MKQLRLVFKRMYQIYGSVRNLTVKLERREEKKSQQQEAEEEVRDELAGVPPSFATVKQPSSS